jgi:hypothetical protein
MAVICEAWSHARASASRQALVKRLRQITSNLMAAFSKIEPLVSPAAFGPIDDIAHERGGFYSAGQLARGTGWLPRVPIAGCP